MAVTVYADQAQIQARQDPDATNWSAEELMIIDMALEAASREIDQYTRRFFGKTDSTVRYFSPRQALSLTVPDLVSVSAIEIDTSGNGTYDTTLTSSDYYLWPNNAATENPAKPYTKIIIDKRSTSSLDVFTIGVQRSVKVTGVWGWPSIPSDIERVTIFEALRAMKEEEAPTGVVGSAELGGVTLTPTLHPRSQRVLNSYIRMGRLDG